jgi:hypothetical protein
MLLDKLAVGLQLWAVMDIAAYNIGNADIPGHEDMWSF